MTPTDLWAARRERARAYFQAGGDLRGYPALSAEDETEATLAAHPPEKAEKKPRPPALERFRRLVCRVTLVARS